MYYETIKGNVRVTLDDECNEGFDGFYDPEDEEDRPLLRFSVDMMEEGVWVGVDNASYCTLLPAALPTVKAKAALDLIMSEVYGPLVEGASIKKTCERLSWLDEHNL